MTTHTFSYMLKNSGAVLAEVVTSDVLLERRDGDDVVLSTKQREETIRDGLTTTTRLLAGFLLREDLYQEVSTSAAESLPWVSWLSTEDRELFLGDLVRTTQACLDTEYFQPLTTMLSQWKVTAQVSHDPRLQEFLSQPIDDSPTVLTRPHS